MIAVLKNTMSSKKLPAILLIGILGGSTILGLMILIPKDNYVAFGQVAAPSVMDVKLTQAIQTLSDCDKEKDLCQQAIDEMMEALFVSNLVPLPSPTLPAETDQSFQEHQQRLDEAIQALSEHVNDKKAKDTRAIPL